MNDTGIAFAALLLAGGAAALWFRRMVRGRIPKNRTGFVAAWAGGAGLGVVALAQGVGWTGGVLAVLAILLGGVLTGLVGISRQRVAPGAVQVGAALGDFSATDEHGRPFRLSSLAGKPILLKFFRGHW